MRGRLYSSCVRSSMLHGSETWPVRKENVVALQRAEMRMVRWMCDWLRRSRTSEITNDVLSAVMQNTWISVRKTCAYQTLRLFFSCHLAIIPIVVALRYIAGSVCVIVVDSLIWLLPTFRRPFSVTGSLKNSRMPECRTPTTQTTGSFELMVSLVELSLSHSVLFIIPDRLTYIHPCIPLIPLIPSDSPTLVSFCSVCPHIIWC